MPCREEMSKRIATRLRYGLLNEPVPPENSPITTAQMYDMLYQAVRAIDSKHAIFMGAFFNFDALGSPASNGWTNVVYETHHYDDENPFDANGQGGLESLEYLRIGSIRLRKSIKIFRKCLAILEKI